MPRRHPSRHRPGPRGRLAYAVLGSFALLFLAIPPGSSFAQPVPLTGSYRILDLAARRIALLHLPPDLLTNAIIQKVTISDSIKGDNNVTQSCQLKIEQAALVPDGFSDCPALWAQKDPDTITLAIKAPKYEGPLVLQRTKADARDINYTWQGTILVASGLPRLPQAALCVPILTNDKLCTWTMVSVQNGQIVMDPNLARALWALGDLRLAAVGEAGDYSLYALHRSSVVSAVPSSEALRPQQAPLDCGREVEKNGYALGRSPVYCIDTTPDQQLKMAGLPKNQFVVPPNQTLFVVVRTWDDFIPSVTMTGTVGLSDPRLNIQAQSGGVEALLAIHTSYVTVSAFAPRQSGQSPSVTVRLTKRSDRTAAADPMSFDLAVDVAYYGALRLGMALGFGHFDRGYQAQKLGGSAVSEVVATAETSTNLELVLGFAPYLDGLFSGQLHGRTYGGGLSLGIAPYFGIGILGQGNKGLDAFRSFHVGIELELVRNFSIAVTYVGRFVNSLPDGVAVGSPVPDGTLATHAGFVSGGAVVLNLAPEFFKFAAGGIK